MKSKSRHKWTKEEVQKIALLYPTRNQFYIGNTKAYDAARHHGWLDEICCHMKVRRPLTKEECIKEARKYNKRCDFKKHSCTAYKYAKINGWLDEITSDYLKFKRHIWSKEACMEVAQLCKSKTELKTKFPCAYAKALKKGWVDEICCHMDKIGDRKHRAIYVFEFEDKCAYIGLTCNLRKRQWQHLHDGNKSSVYKHFQATGAKFIFKALTDYLPVDQSKEAEGYFVNYYKSQGWKILNQRKTGGVGKDELIWNPQAIEQEAKKYKTFSEFKQHSPAAYSKAREFGILEEVGKHMPALQKQWNDETVALEAKKYKTKTEFQQNASGAFSYAHKNHIINEITAHMQKTRRWSAETILDAAATCKSISEFHHNYGAAYNKAKILGILEDIRAIIPRERHQNWTKEECQVEALKYKTRNEFRKGSGSAYMAAHRKGWLNSVCYHMGRKLNGHKK